MYKIDSENNVWFKVSHYDINNEFTPYTFQKIESLPYTTTYKTSQGYYF